jgi:dienelactone hydrolase
MIWAVLLAVSAFAQTAEQRTRQALDLILARKYDAFYSMFSPEMKRAISLETFGGQMNQLLEQLGPPSSFGEPRTAEVQGSPLVMIPIRWPAATLIFQVSWNKQWQVQGTFIRPENPPAPSWTAPDYVKPAEFTGREVTVGEDRWKLPGILLVPKGKGPFPAVVLVHGSGPHDRDETVGGTKVFRDLAEGLGSRGIAVLRYVKRTKQYPVSEAASTVVQETVEDAVRAAALLRSVPEVDARRVFVLGHSLGGYVMPRILSADSKIHGGIVMAGNLRPLDQLIAEQMEYLSGKAPEDPWSVLKGLPQGYIDDLKSYDATAMAKKIDVPMLILQGERDYQVTMKDYRLWQSALEGRQATFHSYPGLNHLFVAGEGKSMPAEYQRPGHVSGEVIEDIAQWIQSRR